MTSVPVTCAAAIAFLWVNIGMSSSITSISNNYVESAQLLTNPHNVLLTIDQSIATESVSDRHTFCTVMDNRDGRIIDVLNQSICDDMIVRDWTEPDVDPTNTSVIRLTVSQPVAWKYIFQTAIQLELKRNGELVTVDTIGMRNMYTADSMADIIYKSFTINSMNTTVIMYGILHLSLFQTAHF